jgi:hypothetical protein
MRGFMRLQFSAVGELQRAIGTFLLVMKVCMGCQSKRVAHLYFADVADKEHIRMLAFSMVFEATFIVKFCATIADKFLLNLIT